MAEVLSQNEIDQLLAALSSGAMDTRQLQEEEAPKVRRYDFKRALRLSKDQIRSLSRIHEGYARLLSSFLSARLRTYVEVELLNVEQLPYEEFIRSIPDQTLILLFIAEPLEGRLALEIPSSVAFAILDRILGGQGKSNLKKSSFTEIDAMLLEKLFRQSFTCYQEAWETVLQLSPQMDGIEYNPQFIQLASANDTVIAVSLSMNVGENNKGIVNVCIPHIALEPFVPRLSTQYFFTHQQGKKSVTSSEPIQHQLMQTELNLVVELGQAMITMRELLNVEPGDVIQLDHPIDRPIAVKVDDEWMFKAIPGTINHHAGVQIVEFVQPEGDRHEQ